MGGLPQPGTEFGRYRIGRRLGRGGMGVVFQAVQIELGRSVALKLLSPELADSESYRSRFRREAALLAALDSSHVVQVFDAGEHDGWLWIATQLVPEGDLGELLRSQGPLDPAEALTLFGHVTEGLNDAHAAGVLHRDIKPGNVLVRSRNGARQALLCDFGIARSALSELTRTIGVLGTPGYLAPECHVGQEATERSDIYALGCLLWAMSTGEAPYRGTDFDVALAHRDQPVPQLPTRHRASGLNELVATLMAKRPDERPSSAAEVLNLVAALAPGGWGPAWTQELDPEPPLSVVAAEDETLRRDPLLPATTAEPLADPAPRPRRRWPLALGVGIAVTLVGGATAAALLLPNEQAKADGVVASVGGAEITRTEVDEVMAGLCGVLRSRDLEQGEEATETDIRMATEQGLLLGLIASQMAADKGIDLPTMSEQAEPVREGYPDARAEDLDAALPAFAGGQRFNDLLMALGEEKSDDNASDTEVIRAGVETARSWVESEVETVPPFVGVVIGDEQIESEERTPVTDDEGCP